MASPHNVVREQDQYMPIAKVIRIIRSILPLDAKISDDAKETIQHCVSEYISFITTEANDKCQREQRKTVTAEDVLFAMRKLGFDDYVGPLSLYLQRYRESEGKPIAGRTIANYNYILPPPQLPAASSYGSVFPPNVGMFNPSPATSFANYNYSLPPPQLPVVSSYGYVFPPNVGIFDPSAATSVANYNYSSPSPQPPATSSYGSIFPPNVGMFNQSAATSGMFYRNGGSTSGSGNTVDAFNPFAHIKRDHM